MAVSPQFLGTWESDVSTIQPVPKDPTKLAKSILITIKDIGDGRWTTEVVMERGGVASRSSLTFTLDGAPTSVSDHPLVDSVVANSPDPFTLNLEALKDGIPVITETCRLSADGRQMTHAGVTNHNGRQYHMNQTLNRK